MWGATLWRETSKQVLLQFQSTHPCGVRLAMTEYLERMRKFQSTHPCGVRRLGYTQNKWLDEISIHAPMWGATDRGKGLHGAILISIHASMWGATFRCLTNLKATLISIHAPMWGATIWPSGLTKCQINFNPRTHVGCDLIAIILPLSVQFQSTHPCGVRRLVDKMVIDSRNFNPRTHVGCDITLHNWLDPITISIHAPMWGATTVTRNATDTKKISIHAPMWGATSVLAFFIILILFQSTHPCGVRQIRLLLCKLWLYFNPRTHVGCDIVVFPCLPKSYDFNPRTHVGCDILVNHHQDYLQTISIHAPMWGATMSINSRLWLMYISIHAPMWGATPAFALRFLLTIISIHAPMWGATLFFISSNHSATFQSTHPCGVRQASSRGWC